VSDKVFMIVGPCTTYGSFHDKADSEEYAKAIRAQSRGLICWVEERNDSDR
jgi:3-deoxy-D-arabino-heptulosonate 7-phosphate (DAHP) synthase